MKTPQRGEVWLVDLGMAAKVRPAVVMSIPATDVDRALVTIVPHTNSARGARFEAAVSGIRLRRVLPIANALACVLFVVVREPAPAEHLAEVDEARRNGGVAAISSSRTAE